MLTLMTIPHSFFTFSPLPSDLPSSIYYFLLSNHLILIAISFYIKIKLHCPHKISISPITSNTTQYYNTPKYSPLTIFINFLISMTLSNFYLTFILLIFYSLTRILLEISLSSIYNSYFTESITDISIFSIVTSFYFNIIFVVFLYVLRAPILFGLVYAVVGSCFMKNMNIELEVEIGEENKMRFGNVVSLLYFMHSMGWCFVVSEFVGFRKRKEEEIKLRRKIR